MMLLVTFLISPAMKLVGFASATSLAQADMQAQQCE